MKRNIFLISILIIFLITEIKSEKLDNLKPLNFVSDYAEIISEENEIRLNNLIKRFEKATGIEIAVVTLESIGDLSIEEAAVKIFEKWGIGKKGKDNGILVILALKERKVRIEVGYGLEGIITDSLAGSILDSYGIPYFSKNQFDEGFYKIVSAIIFYISKKIGVNFNIEGLDEKEFSISDNSWNLWTVFIIFFIIFILLRFGFFWIFPFWFWGGRGFGGYRDLSSRSWGGFTSGFSGFGGGLSGGAGASRGF